MYRLRPAFNLDVWAARHFRTEAAELASLHPLSNASIGSLHSPRWLSTPICKVGIHVDTHRRLRSCVLPDAYPRIRSRRTYHGPAADTLCIGLGGTGFLEAVSDND